MSIFNPKLLSKYFVRGCLAVAPLAATAYIVYLLLNFADKLLPVGLPGVGIVVAAALITLVGYLTSNVLGRGAIEIFEHFLTRLPLLKLIYSSIKDLIGAFVGDRKSFNHPVTVALGPDNSVRTLGFVTRDDLSNFGLPGCVAVYLPQSYNFAGNLIIVPRERVQPLPVSSTDVMTFIVSGGVSGLPEARPSSLPVAIAEQR
jgi:uncharacterized membrane protein